MNNLYNKIYEAIDNGIQNALIISDDQSQDTSIGWHQHEISSDVNVLNHLVDGLLLKCESSEEYIDYFEQIINCYENQQKKYKVKSFQELARLYYICKYIRNNNLRSVDLSWIDMSNAVTVIMNNYQEVSFDLFDSTRCKAMFVKLKNVCGGHDIILHKNLHINYNFYQWNEKSVNRNDSFNYSDCISDDTHGSSRLADEAAKHDYNGYDHTYHNADITTNHRDTANYPAMEYCKSLNNDYNEYEGYLPAMGELLFLVNSQSFINEMILSKIGGNLLNFTDFNDWWSSTEFHKFAAWSIHHKKIWNGDKENTCYVLPLFRQK